MQILVTNDDGVHSEGLWALVRELHKIAEVTVVAPDKERSAIGTAVSLRQPPGLSAISNLTTAVHTVYRRIAPRVLPATLE